MSSPTGSSARGSAINPVTVRLLWSTQTQHRRLLQWEIGTGTENLSHSVRFRATLRMRRTGAVLDRELIPHQFKNGDCR